MRRILCCVSAFAVVAVLCAGASADTINTVFMIPAVPQPWTAALFGVGVGLIVWSEKLRRGAHR